MSREIYCRLRSSNEFLESTISTSTPDVIDKWYWMKIAGSEPSSFNIPNHELLFHCTTSLIHCQIPGENKINSATLDNCVSNLISLKQKRRFSVFCLRCCRRNLRWFVLRTFHTHANRRIKIKQGARRDGVIDFCTKVVSKRLPGIISRKWSVIRDHQFVQQRYLFSSSW